jgi:histidine ammonia-lyase
MLAIALSEIGALSERRMALLIDSKPSGLPPFLVDIGRVNSGFMIAQVTSAALVSDKKTLAHPASIDSLPTSANQDKHLLMTTFAGRRLRDIFNNLAGIFGIEWLSASQDLDFRVPLETSDKLKSVKALLRTKVSFYDKDRYFSPDIDNAKTLTVNRSLLDIVDIELL